MIELVADFDGLSELVRTTVSSGVSRQALLLRTERLSGTLPPLDRVRHARAALDPLTNAERAHWYDLPGGRIVISWKDDQGGFVNQALDGLNRLLENDAIDPLPMKELVDFYVLPQAGDELLRAAVTGLPKSERVTSPEPLSEQPVTVLQPFEPAELDRLEQSLTGTDLSRFARRRPVSFYNGETSRLAWEERTLSIPELIETVAPGRDARSDVWLFRRLTRMLDRRMLSILSDPGEMRGAGPFSLTLNVTSVLSPEFLRFDAALPAALRSRVVISFLPADIAADAGAFAFARNFARGRSYRVCLRAVSAALLPALDFVALNLDYIQLIWSSELAKVSELPQSGTARWIVGQPFTREAADWGVARGIGLFTMKPSD